MTQFHLPCYQSVEFESLAMTQTTLNYKCHKIASFDKALCD